MKRIVAIILACITIMLFFTACQDSQELGSWAYAYIIGVDKGVADKLRFTILIPTLKQQQSSGGQGMQQQQNGEYSAISIDCPTLYDGLDFIGTFLSRRINYMHCKYFIIGEKLAKEGIGSLMEEGRVARQIRLNMHVIVVKGEASDFINAFSPSIGTSIPKTLEGLIIGDDRTGLIDDETYMDVLQNLKSTKSQATCALGAVNDFSAYLPAGAVTTEKIESGDLYPGQIPRKGGDPVEVLGTVIFLGDRMVGELNANETRALLMVKDEFATASITIHDPLDNNLYVTLNTQKQKSPDIKVILSGDKPVIDVKIFLEGSIINQQSEFDYQSKELDPTLEKAFADNILSNIAETIKKCQALNSDIFGFGEIAAEQFWTIHAWDNYDWLSKFKDAQVNIGVNISIEGTGVIIKNNPVKTGEGENP